MRRNTPLIIRQVINRVIDSQANAKMKLALISEIAFFLCLYNNNFPKANFLVNKFKQETILV